MKKLDDNTSNSPNKMKMISGVNCARINLDYRVKVMQIY